MKKIVTMLLQYFFVINILRKFVEPKCKSAQRSILRCYIIDKSSLFINYIKNIEIMEVKVKVIQEVKNLQASENVLYLYGSFGIVLQSKVSQYGSGKKTVYTGYITEGVEAEEGEVVEVLEECKTYFSNYEITKIQKLVGYINNGSIKTLTDEDLKSAVNKKMAKYSKALTLLATLGAEVITDDEYNTINRRLRAVGDELFEECKQKRDERKTKLETSEAVKKLHALQKTMIDLTKKGDFVALALLAQELAKAQKKVEAEE